MAINYKPLPAHMRASMKLYIEQGVRPGHFLTALLCNDLKGACERADDINKHMLYEYVSWLYNSVPSGCWGGRENFEAWIKQHEKENA